MAQADSNPGPTRAPSVPDVEAPLEPLAAMGAKEAAIILDLVRDLKKKGDVSIIIIAHNYGQVLEICDRVNLLQHGMITFDKAAKDTSVQELNDIVIAEYRRAAQERQRPAANGR